MHIARLKTAVSLVFKTKMTTRLTINITINKIML